MWTAKGTTFAMRGPQYSLSLIVVPRTNFSIGELSEQEFHACYYIPDSISIQLPDKKVSSTDGLPHNMQRLGESTRIGVDLWSGLTEGLDKLFKPTQSLEIPSKETQGHLVEWVEKSSFTRLNKLFKIDQAKWNHTVLLIENNLKVVLAHPKSSVIPVFPRLAPPTLVTAKCSIRALSYIRQYGAFDVSYERTLLSYGKNSNGRIYRPLAKLHSLHGTSNETIEAIMCLKDYMVMQMTEVKHDIIDDILSIPFDDENEVVLGDGVVQRDRLAKGEGFATVHNEVQDTP
uniref:Uncharacterized protein n=1 Tax=Vitis vinifera TaxID=29760 RepID=A5ATU6_VITVI|nr:hypothetical protein VITISV_025606 [Vitis vinifera]